MARFWRITPTTTSFIPCATRWEENMKNHPKHYRKNNKNVVVVMSTILAILTASITAVAIATSPLQAAHPERDRISAPAPETTTVASTISVPTTVEPTTVEPTTAEPTTVAPTTVAPTTAEPTTVEPTTAEPATEEHEVDAAYSSVASGDIIILSPEDRQLIAGIIAGEVDPYDEFGCQLLAQTLRDNWLRCGCSSAAEVQSCCQYDGYKPFTTDCIEQAISTIFDNGGSVVEGRVYFMYAPALCQSDWHESQRFVVEHGGVRYFGTW